jgi:hypothetical protein
VSIESSNDTVSVNTVSLSPAAAEEFSRIMEILGDKSGLIWQPETQKKLLDAYASIAAEDIIDEWKDPTPLYTNKGLPTFPVAGLPLVIRDIVEGLAEEIQVPVDLVAIMALAALSASLVGRVSVQLLGQHRERVTLYALGLAETGNRKSALRKPLFDPLNTAQEQLRQMTEDARIKAAQAKYAAEMRARSAATRAKKDGAGDDDFLAAALAQTEADEIEVPGKPSLFTTDATPEALLVRMRANGERLAVFDAEGGGLLTMAGVRYGSGNSSNIDMLLKSHVGESVDQARVGRDDIELKCPVLTIGVLTQMQTLRELMSVPNSAGRGLVDRFIIAAPPDKLGYRKVVSEPLSPAAQEAYSGLLVGYAVSLWNADTQTLQMSPGAMGALIAYRQESENRLRPGGDLRAMEGFGSKLTGSVVRLAALHHLAHYGVMAAFYNAITEVSMQWGIQAAEWSLAHYRYANQVASEIASVPDAEKVLRWLKRRSEKTETITKREVVRQCNLKAEEAGEALKFLYEHHYVRPAREIRKSGSGGRVSENWEVNPALL